MRSSFMRLIVWICFNLFLVAAILFILEFFNIWSVTRAYDEYFKPADIPITQQEDPLLLDKEQLKKAQISMKAYGEVLKTREIALEEAQKRHDQLILRLKQKSDQLIEKEKRLNQQKEESDNRNKRLESIASQLTNMPPPQAVRILEGIDTLTVIEILNQIDKSAAEAGTASVASYYISLIASPPEGKPNGQAGGRDNPKKAQEIVRLKAKFAGEEINDENLSKAENELAQVLPQEQG